MKKNILFALCLIGSFSASASTEILSKTNPASIERTAESGQKIKVILPVNFEREVCVKEVTEHRACGGGWSYYGPGFFGPGFMFGGGYFYGGRFYGGAHFGAYGCSYQRCVEKEVKTISELRTVTIKFKRGTELRANETERYELTAVQSRFNTNRIYSKLEAQNTVQNYKIKSRGAGRIVVSSGQR